MYILGVQPYTKFTGCPLSPLLFNLSIEPLAAALRMDPRIRGITRGNTIHKCSLYADDLLLYITDPEASIPLALDLIGSFGRLSRYRLNLAKSTLFPVNSLAKEANYSAFQFRLEHSSSTDLGIQITDTYQDLFKQNFTPLLEKTKSDLARWSVLPISLAGRVNTIKMVVLPRFMYLFQMIPLFLPKTFFTQLDGLISSYIWDKKVPRIRKSLLQCSKSEGAANIVKLSTWMRANVISNFSFLSQSNFTVASAIMVYVKYETKDFGEGFLCLKKCLHNTHS
uniref:Reverse transcriptase domain-containing protein n=1 Tax=Neolamprologus brichardi TaxID=32507 RepID=A0A3Q4GNV2_NEOBR